MMEGYSMKRNLFVAAAIMLAVFASCEVENIDNSNSEIQDVASERSSVFPEMITTSIEGDETKAGWDYNSGLKTYTHHWDINDEILVYKDGKMATYKIASDSDAISGTFTYVKESTNYAGYNGSEYIATYNIPESSVYSSKIAVTHNDVYYGNYNTVMIARSNTTSFAFKHVLGWMKLQLTGNKAVKSININAANSKLISGEFDIDFNGNITDLGNMEYPYISVDYSTNPVQLDEDVASAFYIPMLPKAYSQSQSTQLDNVEVVFTDDERESKYLPSEITIERNKVIPLSEKFFGTRAQWVNANKDYRANCYFINSSVSGIENKIYKFMATYKGNSTVENISGGARAAVIWETANTTMSDAAISAGIIIPKAWFANGNIYFTVTPNCTGNAVIALYDNSDNILWSWHIWVPGVADETITPITVDGKVSLMQNNLGAVPSASDFRVKAGLYYQWGRKDPFAQRALALGDNRMATVPADVFSVSSSYPSNHGEDHPTVFYSSIYGWRYPSSSDEWSDAEKTIYDPCPYGWRVMRKSSIATAIPGGSMIQYYTSEEAEKGWAFVLGISNLGGQNVNGYNFSQLTDYSSFWTACAEPSSDPNKPLPWSLNNNSSRFAWLYQVIGPAIGAFVRCERE